MLKSIIRLIIVLGIPCLISLWFYRYLHNYFFEPLDPTATDKVIVELKPGTTFRSFCKELEDQKILRSWRVLDIISQLKGRDTQIKAGEYEFSAKMTAQEILQKLASGDVLKRILLVKEGVSIWNIGSALEEANIVNAQDFEATLTSTTLLEQAGIPAENFEGYLFPETYQFSGKQTPANVIWTMLAEFQKNWDPAWNERLKEINFTQHEIVTLASVIEKESGNHEEQPMISSVFHNRLKAGMKLQSDPTTVYDIPNFKGPILEGHLNRESPYNTYLNYGLPKGPICNPGLSAIKAALYPETSENLFFVANGRGGHVFSKTLREHNLAVQDYRAMISASQSAPTVN